MKSLYEAEGRKAWVDLGKGISILLVVLFHCEESGCLFSFSFQDIFLFPIIRNFLCGEN